MKKILIITQKVDENDPVLGFFCRWIMEFAKSCEKVTVICLSKGKYDLPKNVKVLSLGKESGKSRLDYIFCFYRYIYEERRNYDVVFVHMNQVYIVLAGLIWRMWSKKIILWYTHRSVSLSLRIATWFADHILTASKEGFNISTRKLRVLGHGIDIERFGSKNVGTQEEEVGNRTARQFRQPLALLSMGRITRIKNLETLVEACSILVEKGVDFICELVGPKVTSDDSVYFNELQKLLIERSLGEKIRFVGEIPHIRTQEFYWKSDININLAPTGGMDKSILEGVVAGVVPLASNKAFEALFGSYKNDLIFEYKNPVDLAEKIISLKNIYVDEMMNGLRQEVSNNFSVEKLVRNILDVGYNSK